MHSHDRDLKKLLTDDMSSAELQPVTAHVETCSVCQDRLAALSTDARWSTIAIEHLRDSGPEDFEFENCQSAISIELNSELAEGVAVETESVELDFLSPAVHPELLGRLGRYDIERVIGTGGMGVVLKAHDSELNRIVAIKVLAPHLANNSSARRRFAREVQAAAAVLHPNVLPIYNVESDGKLPYLVMQYVHGPSLQARVDRDGPLDIAVALRIAKQTAAGLAAAHEQGLVHRDVKPANILLEGEVERAQLSDFGLARTVDDASLTRTGIVAGTPHYMSPEQASGESIDSRSDLYSLGSVIYFMLTGHPPFRAESAMAVLNRICHHSHRPVHHVNAAVPRELSQLIDRLLTKSPDKRFASATEVERSLDQLLSALRNGSLRLVSDRKETRVHRRQALFAMVATVAIVLGSTYAWRSYFVPRTNTNQQESQLGLPNLQNQPANQPSIDSEIALAIVNEYPRIVPKQDDQWTQLAQTVTGDIEEYEQLEQRDLESFAAIELLEIEWQETAAQLQSELDQLESELGSSQSMPVAIPP